LVLFITEAEIVKGKKVYDFLGMILDLHPIIRKASFHVISFLYWECKVIDDFNNIVNEHLDSFKDLLQSGIFLESLKAHLNIQLDFLIGDAQCRAKMVHTKQYNGEFGCSICLNPGVEWRRSFRVYEFRPDYNLREHVGYLADLRRVENNNDTPSNGKKKMLFYLCL